MDEIKVAFKDALKPGLIISLITIAISTTINILVPDLQLAQKIGWITWIVIAALYFFYTKSFGVAFQGSFTYGKAFVYMLYMTIIVSAAVGIFTYIYYGVIDPGYIDKILEIAEEKMYENPQLTDEQIDAAIEMQKKFMGPGMMAVSATFMTALLNIVISLIVAIFTRNEKQNQFTLD